MNEIINYFSTIPSSHRSLILVSGITFWLIENAFPLLTLATRNGTMLVSIYFTLTTIVINFLLAFVLLKTDWTVGNNFGILQWLPEIPLWLYTLIGLLLLDLIGVSSRTPCRTQN
jgi:hypothetical protein